jgi:SAM-dependent methyltransferase
LQYIEGEPRFTILDFGCGPGRDLKVVAELGHIAVGLEGAAHFADMARAYSGCEVWQQDFLKLDLPNNYFDGVSPTLRYFMYPARSCRASCWNCTQV